MDKILSARVDEMIVSEIAFLAHKLHVSKKNIIEQAVQMYAQHVKGAEGENVFSQTSGAWKRKEKAAQTVTQARNVFNKSMTRHQI